MVKNRIKMTLIVKISMTRYQNITPSSCFKFHVLNVRTSVHTSTKPEQVKSH